MIAPTESATHEYTSREIRLIEERAAALLRAENAEERLSSLEQAVADSVRRLDDALRNTNVGGSLEIEMVTRRLAFLTNTKRDR